MNHVVGIIAEYNPFHNGHLYHLNQTKKLFPDATIVLILSGNFTQRGTPAILDKWTRTKHALEAGVDIVVELPFPFATAAADIFASGAIKLCHELGVTDLVFGSESNDIKGIQELVEVELNNKDFPSLVQVYLRMGYNYPTALSRALEDITGTTYSLPNDILGISYVKAIKKNHYSIIPHTIKRTNEYHNKELDQNKMISSATSIRLALQNKEDIKEHVPSYVLKSLKDMIPYKKDDIFPLYQYKIITDPNLEEYHLVDSGLAKRLKKEITKVNTLDELIKKVKRKNMTYATINRILLYIICGFTKGMAKNMNDISYIRLLGFSKKGQSYLNRIKKDIDIPIVSKFSRERDNMLEFEYQTTKVYALFFKTISPKIIEQEYKNIPIRKEEQNETND